MPADDYTPTMDEVREVFCRDADGFPAPERGPEFDRALAAHDAELRERIAGEILALVDPKYDSRTWGSGMTDSPGAAFRRALQHAANAARGKE